jgi:hypothetical protein
VQPTVDPAAVAGAILASLSNLPVKVAMTTDCAAPISASFVPGGQIVTSGTDALFTETISVAVGAAGGTYVCKDWALLNGEPMRDPQTREIIYETKTIHVPGIDLTPDTATNELGTPGQTHTVTATVSAGTYGPVAGVNVSFAITAGPNAGGVGAGVTDASGQVTYTYAAVQGPAGLGTDTIKACFKDALGNDVCDTATKTWQDTTPPTASCQETVNPYGKTTPPAGTTTPPGTSTKGPLNPDGFYRLNATDAVWPSASLQMYVIDTGSGTVFGPYPVGTNILYTEAPDSTPVAKPIGSTTGQAGAVSVHIIGTGDAAIYAVDGSGNTSTSVSCLVPPPPQ